MNENDRLTLPYGAESTPIINMTMAQEKAYHLLCQDDKAAMNGILCSSVEGLVLEEIAHTGLIKKCNWGDLFESRWFLAKGK